MTYLLSQLLTQSATRHADATAVVDPSGSYTYRELDEASNRFANHLISVGAKRGDRVGLYLEKSREAVAGLFGILKAGCAYVPLDPGSPLARAAYMINDCQMAAMICSKARYEALLKFREIETTEAIGIVVDGEASWRKASPLPPPDPHAIERDLAYMLYTSGSTGNPKGVMISHRAALTFIEWASEEFDVRPGDRVSNHAPFHFDLSTFDLFASIKAGATVVIVPPALSLFPVSLAKFISEQRIAIWYSVPSALTRLLLYGNLKAFDFSALRTVLFAGEVFPVKYLGRLMDELPDASFHNLYGPTETNVCTWYTVPKLEPDRTEPIPIGKGCPNHEILVLGDDGKPVERGQAGELCVRGPGLMTGYWGLRERTARALAPCVLYEHLGPEPVYRTGDLVRQDSDGNYLYIGRRDNQIKSRGYRIELGEIETALISHPDIEEAAVVPIPDDEIGNQIKAFVVFRNGTSPGLAAIEGYCSVRLPKYMVPHQMEIRSSLPKTSTGKVDKSTLLAAQKDTTGDNS